MDIIIDIFFAILLVWSWVALIKYRRILKSWTWNFVWAERYLWNGWTYLVLILFWCFLMVWWFLYPFWGLELLLWVKPDTETEFKIR